MQLEHQFTVPAPPEVVWAAVVDPARVAPCMPGATLTEVNGSEFTGSVKVKLGPVSLLYKGSGQFVEIDEQSRRVVIKASGKDSRGNGTASATVTVTLKADGANTHGSVVTDLSITGKPAQFGRGMISEVGGKVLDTFAGALAAQLGVEAPEPAPKPTPRRRTSSARTRQASPAPAPTAEPAAETPDEPAKPAAPKAQPKAAAPKPAPAAKQATAKPAASKTEPTEAESEAAKPAPKAAAAAKPKPSVNAEVQPTRPVAAVPATNGASVTARAEEPTSTPPKLHVVAEPEPQVEAIDLLDYAGPSVLKRVLPLVAGAVVVFLLVRWLRRR